MNTLAAISFYLSLVFGFGFGLIGFFQIGRVGAIQFFHWLSGFPPSNASGADNAKLALGSAGIPTSLTDILASMSGLSGLKSFGNIYSYFSRNLREILSYFSSIFGRALSKLWIYIGIPAFILSVVTSRTGHEYWPKWLNEVGIQSQLQFIIAIVSSYFAAYLIGRLIGSPQRDFNKARILYESVVAREGYWFDHRNSPKHYAQYEAALSRARDMYDRLASVLKNANDEMSRQRFMILHYQRALLLSTLGDYKEAEIAIEQSRKYKLILNDARVWEPQEKSVFESQLLFLEGELAYVRGYREKAINKFHGSMEIDSSLQDQEGVIKNEERLQIISSV